MSDCMTREAFVRALKRQTSDAALFGTITLLNRPAGRKPLAKDVALSEWYRSLPESDQENVISSMRESAELAVFSFLCILDGVSAIEDGPDKGLLVLNYSNANEQLDLNPVSEEPLHDLYNQLCKLNPEMPRRAVSGQYATGTAQSLRRVQHSSDGSDLHAVPTGMPDSAGQLAIALPKAEHRKL